jgi:hypothetical protein
VVVILVALIVAALLPWTIKVSADCELAPAQSRVIDSPLDKVQILEIVRESGQVRKGEVIARLNDDELQMQREAANGELKQEQASLANLRSDTQPAAYEISRLKVDKLKKEVAFLDGQIAKCQVRAPIDGMILTPQLKQHERRTVNKGDVICEIADMSAWELRLDVPQEEIGWVQRGLVTENGPSPKPLAVEFFLESYPEYRLKTQIDSVMRIGQMGQTKEKGNVFEVRVPVAGEQLRSIENSLLSGSKGVAKIATVDRPLGYVLLRKVIRFFRVTFF